MASLRLATPSLRKIAEMWLPTVLGASPSRCAIVALFAPVAIASSTSRSRGESPARTGDSRGAVKLASTLGDSLSEDHVPTGDRPDRPFDLVLISALEQVAAGAGPQRLRHHRVLVEHGQDQYSRAREVSDDLPGGGHPVQRRHSQVHDHHVRAAERHLLDRLGTGAGLADHLDPVEGLEQCRQPPPDHRVIVGEHHPDGRGR